MKSALIGFLVLVAWAHLALADDDIDTIKRVLKSPRREWTRWPWQEHADDLKAFGDRALPLLATLLPDSQLGYEAAQTMLVIDPRKAAPLLFASIPPADRNVQNVAFSHFLHRVDRGETFPFLGQMHDAAVRCLRTGTNADAAETAIYVLGVTGTEKDFELLESYHHSQHPTEFWSAKLQNAAEEVLARLGDASALESIERQISVVPAKPQDMGEAVTLVRSIAKAGYSRNPRFIPFLARLLDIPPPDNSPSDDFVPPSPSSAAGVALDKIVNGVPTNFGHTKIDWKAWWKKNQSNYAK